MVQKTPEHYPTSNFYSCTSQCDSVPAYFRIGKQTAIEIFNEVTQSPARGEASLDLKKATVFIAKCYGENTKGLTQSMSDVRFAMWKRKNTSSKMITQSVFHNYHQLQNALSRMYTVR